MVAVPDISYIDETAKPCPGPDPDYSVPYFRSVVESEGRALAKVCQLWDSRLRKGTDSMPEEAQVNYHTLFIHYYSIFKDFLKMCF